MNASRSAELALAEIDRGHFGRARDIARDIISQSPRDAAALHVLGLAEFRLGRHKDAIEALRRSLRVDPSQPLAHLALANVLQDQGQLHSAITSYRRALRLDPGSAAAHNDLGTALYASGNIEEAVREFEKALSIDSRLAMTYENLGSALRRAGRFADARRAFSRSLLLRIWQGLRRLLGLRPLSGAAQSGTGVAAKASAAVAIRLHTEGKVDEALVECERLLAQDPDNAEALHIKGLSLIDREGPGSALPLLERAATLQPLIPEFQNSLGIGLQKHGRTADALGAFSRAIHLNPEFTEAHLNLSQLAADQEMFDHAERAARTVLAVQPESIVARHTLTRALQGQGKYEEMERIARETLALDRSQVDSWLYLGQALREQNQIVPAQEAFEEALRLGPQVPMVHLTLGAFSLECKRDAAAAIDHYRGARLYEHEPPMGASRFNESVARFATGDYSEESWDLYEARRSQGARAAAYRKIPLPEWQGPSDAGQSLLIYGEQGIGDEIMFSSMIPGAASSVRRCALACDPQLRDLFARSFSSVACIAWPRENLKAEAQELRGATAATPIGSLGRYFRSSREKFPGNSPYLIADPVKTEAWRARLRQIGPPPYYGVAWEGGLWKSGRGRRSIPLSSIAAQLEKVDARWVSLQKGSASIEKEVRGTSIVHWQDALDSADDCAALIAALDGVTSVCSWIVHLAGALGQATIALAPFVPEWRYGLSGERMIWYPSVRILRQPGLGDWAPVLGALRASLQDGSAWT